MSIRIQAQGPETIVEFEGKLDSSLPPQDRERILSVVKPGCRLVLDISRLTEISSAGLRMLLLFCRHVQAVGGTVSGTGISQELKEIAEAAGFAQLFRQLPTIIKRPIPPAFPRLAIDAYPTHHHAGYALRPGFPIPMGATPLLGGINFSIFSRHATACTLVLFESGQRQPFVEIPFPIEFRIGDVFAMIVFDVECENLEYGFRMDGPFVPSSGHRFDPKHVLLDPMARSISGRDVWGAQADALGPYPFRARTVPQDFDWEEDRSLQLPIEDLIIYEMHVRGFTASPSSNVKDPGTFAGLREKIPYLKKLGVNCVELLPVFEFDEQEGSRVNPLTGERLWNFWGYSTIGFYAPKAHRR